MEEIKFDGLNGLLKVRAKGKRVWVDICQPTDCFFLENQQEVDEFIQKLQAASKKAFE